LNKYGLLDPVIDFAAETGVFEFAFELCRFGNALRLPEIKYRYAMSLEDEGKYMEAEAIFIECGKTREAILMHIHNEDWDRALFIAEKHEPQSVADVCLANAKWAFHKQEFAKAEMLFLKSQRPEIAMQMYKEANMWEEAIRFAKVQVPGKLAELQAEYGNGRRGSMDELLRTARQLEQSKEYEKAVDIYLSLDAGILNKDLLHQSWLRAVDISTKFCGSIKARQVAIEVAQRLQRDEKWDIASELYLGAELYTNAVHCCIEGQMWDKARKIASIHAPDMKDEIESSYVKHLKNQGASDLLTNVNVSAALDVLVKRKEWDKCLHTAADQGPEILAKYMYLFCKDALVRNDKETLCKTVYNFGTPLSEEMMSIYDSFCTSTFVNEASADVMVACREILCKLVSHIYVSYVEGVSRRTSD
jgi:intraflagellar transport protein 172